MQTQSHPRKAPLLGRAAGVSLALLGALLIALPSRGAEGSQPLRDFRRVVIDDRALPVQKAAAEELAHYCERITGQKLEILPTSQYQAGSEGLSFFVGDAVAKQALGLALAPWKDEEWVLRTVPRGLLVAGDDRSGDAWSIRTPAGSMLATYSLLEDTLGVHWYWPGEFGEHVPRKPDAVVPRLDLRSSPRFAIRAQTSVGYSSYHTQPFKEASRKWMRRNRQGWIAPAWFGHSWDYAFDFKSGENLRNHPEWFALVKGKRRGPQMCTTHPDVINRMVEFVLNDKATTVSISPSDGGGFCECTPETKSEAHRRLGLKSCTELDVPGRLAYDGTSLSLSDRIFTYANEVARRVREKDPNKKIGIFAYALYNKPPVRIQRMEPNLRLSFAYQSAGLRDPQVEKEWRETVAAWQKVAPAMVVRECWGLHYYFDLPLMHYDQTVRNLAEAARLGFVSAYGEGSKSFATQAPNFWAVNRMLWDPARDPSKVMEEFFNSAYGPVASEMKAYFETYNQALNRNWEKRRLQEATRLIGFTGITNSWDLLLPRSVVETAERHLAEAERKAPPGEYAGRVRFHRLGQDYTRVMLELLDTYRQLAALGLKLDTFSPVVEQPRSDEADKQKLLRRAYELGEQREKLLLAHRDWAALDEGLLGYANDMKRRQWHAAVKKALGITQPTAITREKLNP